MNWFRNLSLVALFVLIFPILLLLFEGLGPMFSVQGYRSSVFTSIVLTIFSSALAAVVSFALFTPLAYYFARTKNIVAETLADIPAVIPHPIVGVAVLIFASPLTPTGKLLQSLGISLFDSVLGLVIALTVVSAPIYIKSIQPFFESMNLSPEYFAMGLGASKGRTFLSVVLPNSGKGLITASLIAISRAMSEFGSIAIVAYYVLQYPFVGVSPISVLIYNDFTSGGVGLAVTESAVMILISIGLMVGLRLVNRFASGAKYIS